MPSNLRLAMPGLALSLGVVGLAALGCQGGAAPTAPSGTSQAPSTDFPLPQALPVGTSALGLYDFTLDPVSQAITLSPVREGAAVGDAFTLDATGAMTTGQFGCGDCLQVSGVSVVTGGPTTLIDVAFDAVHPFPVPASNATATLHANNLRLVVLADGTDAFFGTAPDGAVTTDAGLVANADGYVNLPTGLVTVPTPTAANLFPFVVFESGDNLLDPDGNYSPSTGWASNLTSPTGYNVFAMGSTLTESVQFAIPTGSASLKGRLALIANYVAPGKPNPVYYLPEGAMAEAWGVTVTPPTTFTDDPSAQNDIMKVDVTDWQAGGTVDAAYPNPSNPIGLKASGDVAEVRVSIPGFGATIFTSSTPTGGNGTVATPYGYDISITKPAGAIPAGDYLALVKVLDERTNLTGLQGDLETPVVIAEVATYQTTTITLIPGNSPPTCAGYLVNGAASGPFTVTAGCPVDFAFDFTNDDSAITLVELDTDYDGSNFTADDNRATAGSLFASFDSNKTVAFRFTDDDTATTVCTATITVAFPTPVIGAGALLTGSSSGNNGSHTRFDTGTNRTNVASHGNNVYVVFRQGSSPYNTFVIRSADGGATWGTPLQVNTGVVASYNSGALGVTSDGSAVIHAGNRAVSPFDVYLTRILPGAGNAITLDAGATNILLANTVTGYDTAQHFDPSVIAHPSNPAKVYVAGTDVFTTVTQNRVLRILDISNANVGVPTFARLGGAAEGIALNNGGTTGGIFDPIVVAEDNGDLHAMGVFSNTTPPQIHYREYEQGTGLFRGATSEIVGTIPSTSNQSWFIGIGVDDLPVITYSEEVAANRDIYLVKATNASAPTFTGVTRVLVSDTSTGTQNRPQMAVDKATNRIFIGYGDVRDIGQSSATRMAAFLSIWEWPAAGVATKVHCDIKMDAADGPGFADNASAFGDTSTYIAQDGSPTAKQLLYFWIDGDNAAGTDDIWVRRGNL